MTDTQTLIEHAIRAAQNAYIPYSGYPVGAAIQTKSGLVFTGCNIENASYPAGICAERTALFKAVSEGYQDFVTIALVTENGGTPCGICRQALAEFAPDLRVIIADVTGHIHHDLSLRELLPLNFSAKDLIKR